MSEFSNENNYKNGSFMSYSAPIDGEGIADLYAINSF